MNNIANKYYFITRNKAISLSLFKEQSNQKIGSTLKSGCWRERSRKSEMMIVYAKSLEDQLWSQISSPSSCFPFFEKKNSGTAVEQNREAGERKW